MSEQGIGGGGSWFIVEFDYREREAGHGAREEASAFRRRIYATTEEAAIRRAATEFRRIAAMAGAARSITAVRCRCVHGVSHQRELSNGMKR